MEMFLQLSQEKQETAKEMPRTWGEGGSALDVGVASRNYFDLIRMCGRRAARTGCAA